MAMQYLPTVAMRSNPKTWLKTIFIIQRKVLESYFCSRSWSLYIVVSQATQLKTSHKPLIIPKNSLVQFLKTDSVSFDYTFTKT